MPKDLNRKITVTLAEVNAAPTNNAATQCLSRYPRRFRTHSSRLPPPSIFLLETTATRSDAAARAKRKSENKRETRKQERSPEDEAASWRSVKEAGVSFWINDITGVATDECPHESLRPMDPKKHSTVGGASGSCPETSPDLDIGFGQEEGTGALVYDSSEFEQAMRILDGGLPARP